MIDDPIGGAGLGDDAPGAVLTAAGADPVSRAARDAARGDQHGAGADRRHEPLALLRGEPAAALRPGGGVRAPAAHPGRLERALRARRAPGPSSWSTSAATASRSASPASSTAPLDAPGAREAALAQGPRLRLRGGLMLDRDAYARTYGATTGDRIRLGDSGLRIRIEHDATQPGDELLLGFGKTGRDGLMAKAVTGTCDFVIPNVVIVDPILGVRKAAIGIRDGRIAAIGRAGNPDTMDGPIDVVVGVNTAVYSGEGLIATAGVDRHARPPAVAARRRPGARRRHHDHGGAGLRPGLEPRRQPGLRAASHARRDGRLAAQHRAAGARLLVAARAARGQPHRRGGGPQDPRGRGRARDRARHARSRSPRPSTCRSPSTPTA